MMEASGIPFSPLTLHFSLPSASFPPFSASAFASASLFAPRCIVIVPFFSSSFSLPAPPVSDHLPPPRGAAFSNNMAPMHRCTDPNTTPFSAPRAVPCQLLGQLHHTARTDRLRQSKILRAVFWNTAPVCLPHWHCHPLLTMAGR